MFGKKKKEKVDNNLFTSEEIQNITGKKNLKNKNKKLTQILIILLLIMVSLVIYLKKDLILPKIQNNIYYQKLYKKIYGHEFKNKKVMNHLSYSKKHKIIKHKVIKPKKNQPKIIQPKITQPKIIKDLMPNKIPVPKIKKIDNKLKIQNNNFNNNLSNFKVQNNKEIAGILLKIENDQKNINNLSKTITMINQKFNETKNIVSKFDKSNYITDVELKKYFKQNNLTLSDLISKKFIQIDKSITKLSKDIRVNHLKYSIMNMQPHFKEKITAQLISNIEFEYIGYKIIRNEDKSEKIAFIAKSNSEKIYDVSIGTEIENKYKIINLDSDYLYLKSLINNNIYKLAILK